MENSRTAVDVAILETARLVLRGLRPRDLESYQRNFVDYEVIRYLARQVPWPYPGDGMQRWYEGLSRPNPGEERWVWGIFRKAEPLECIGAVDLFRPGKPQNRGFWLARAHWGRGYMTEATHRITDYAFDELGFQRLVFSNASGNFASRRIKEKSGARLLGVQAGEYVDRALSEKELWELSKEDWEATEPRGQATSLRG